MFNKNFAVKTFAVCAALIGVTQADLLHTTTQWQSLGIETIADGGATNSNNGVMWTLRNDDGTFGAFGNSDFNFNVGDVVKFKVTLYKEYQGTHAFDALKVWINDDVKLTEALYLKDNGNAYTGSGGTTPYFDIGTVNDSYDYFVNYTVGTDDFSLTARVTCSDDLADVAQDFDGGKQNVAPYWVRTLRGWQSRTTADRVTQNDWNAFTRTKSVVQNGFGQGETETYAFHVTNVPEPTLLSLLGCGLLGLLFVRRRK